MLYVVCSKINKTKHTTIMIQYKLHKDIKVYDAVMHFLIGYEAIIW